jgi:hypothetical protein
MTEKKYNPVIIKTRIPIEKLTFHKLDWLEGITIVLCCWFMFYPKPYELLFTALLIIPILGLILNGINGRPSIASLVHISVNEDGKDKYDVADFIDFSAWAILFRVIVDIEFESYYSLIIPGVIGFVVVLLILFTTHKLIAKSTKNKVWIYASLIFSVFMYSFAATYGANCVYDTSEPLVYDAKVIGKRYSKSRKGASTFYVEVTPWGHHHDTEEIVVSAGLYGEVEIGQTVKIDYKKGLFNIPWYFIERESKNKHGIDPKNSLIN